ncbi:MAG: molybdopterin-dependent oxidoreductase [Myxococcaceae bacterium]|nr:molybdopterin-dependent oxidoreductase [Myxococcaceae bacterium]
MRAMKHLRACTLCEATCGVVITTENGRITDLRGDPDDPFSKGYLCPKAMGLKDVHEDPDRLKTPRVREGSTWKEVSWDEAFARTAEALGRVQREHGRDAVGMYLGNPSVHNLGSILYAPLFMRALRTKNRFSATSVDQLPHMLAAYLMFGHQLLFPIPDLDRTDHFLIFGANPAVSNGSLMTAPGMPRRLKELRARGKVIVVDPRHTETAQLATEHHFIRPGTDALALLAMLNVLFEENLTRPGRLAQHTDGLDAVRDAAKAFPPERVAAATGIAADALRTLARDFAAAKAPVAYGRMGISTQEFGALCAWLINCVNLVMGRLDEPGGAMFTAPAVDLVANPALVGPGHFGRWRSRVRGLPEFGSELPAAVLAEEISTDGPGQIRALITNAGNPVLSTPNGAALERALPKLDFMVSVDFYLNETTRHAHVLLPPTFALEREHYDIAFNLLAVRNVAKWSPAVFERSPEQRHDWEIFATLTRLVGDPTSLGRSLRFKAEATAMKALGPRRVLDVLLRTGPRKISVKKLEAAAHGLDLGALEPCFPARLVHKSKRIAAAPAPMLEDLKRLEAKLAAERPDGLVLIGRRDLRTNNSWMHNSERLVKGERRCTLLMHPADAGERKLTDGQKVRLSSASGSVDVELELTEDIMRGVVSMPHGWGHGRDGVQLKVAAAHAGASINDVTDAAVVDALSGNAGFCGLSVSVAASG